MHAFTGTGIRLPLLGGVVFVVVAAMVGIFINQLTTSTPCNCNLDLSARCKQIELYMKGIHKIKGILIQYKCCHHSKGVSCHKCAIRLIILSYYIGFYSFNIYIHHNIWTSRIILGRYIMQTTYTQVLLLIQYE